MTTHLYPNVMLDLETMGTTPGSAIVAIGAVAFDLLTGELGPEFEARITLQSNLDIGLTTDPRTIEWWMGQSDDARRHTFTGDRTHIAIALQAFHSWIGTHTVDVEMWGNGANFDNNLLAAAYRAWGDTWGENQPWKWWNDRCYRTVRSLHPDVPAPAFEGTPHRALDDARHQARHLIAMIGGPASADDDPFELRLAEDVATGGEA